MDIPKKGTPEFALWVAALDIAAVAPLKQGTNVFAAGVDWRLIHDLRAALDQLGLDWRGVKKANDAAVRADRRD